MLYEYLDILLYSAALSIKDNSFLDYTSSYTNIEY